MGCCTGILRTVMFIFNFCCLAVGVVLIAVGTFFYVSVDQYGKLIENVSGLNVVPSLTIAVGVIVFLISFCGCCGAMKNNSCMLITYSVFLIVMLVVQFAGGIYGIVSMKNNGNTIKEEITKDMYKVFDKYGKDQTITTLFQSMQSGLECCGVTTFLDYNMLLPFGVYPGGCCGEPSKENCSIGKVPYADGCGTKLFNVIDSSVHTVAIVALVICAIELCGAIVAICLVKAK